MTIDTNAFRQAVLDDWREYRDSIRGDEAEITRVYAEMTGWFSSSNPTSFADFVNGQRERAEAIARELRSRCPNCDSDNVCEQTAEDDMPMACLDCGNEWDPDA